MEIYLKYFHPELKLGMADPKSVWLLEDEPVKLTVTVYRGNLVYRLPKSGRRISYRQLKKGLLKKLTVIQQPDDLLPF
jgi:hypothetical protein